MEIKDNNWRSKYLLSSWNFQKIVKWFYHFIYKLKKK